MKSKVKMYIVIVVFIISFIAKLHFPKSESKVVPYIVVEPGVDSNDVYTHIHIMTSLSFNFS